MSGNPFHRHGEKNNLGRQFRHGYDRAGKLSHGCVAWLLGLPLPIVILALLYRGCD